ncbi:hypothetical protein [Pseudarthrobacter sp. J47]|uniref:hypothetical protein n=1 Tax=Pseudarthrobacter sp. J47 TaxID=3116482 RepID=UPI002E801C7E|nr:hypothetical protein [Pseudarthrobacter sp. J47]MEE2524335.1 hypothetical protein [Pseudarthrobacter sp. J47]
MGSRQVTLTACDRCGTETELDVVHENSDNDDPEAHVWRTLKFHYIQPWFFICPDCVKAFLKFMAMGAVLPVKVIRRPDRP